jgi:hypothetical protein
MDSSTPFNLTIFTDSTKKVCLCSASFIFIIVLFIISPLSKFFMTSLFMKIISIILMLYTIYLNIIQIESLRRAITNIQSEQIKSQLNMNLLCNYIFTIFIGLLIIFVIKSFF